MSVALITGGAKRVGRALALALAEDGYDIALHYHTSQSEAAETAQQIEALGRKCQLFQTDLAQSHAVEGMLDAAIAAFGSIDVLVNNASLFQRDTLATLSPETWNLHQSVNLLAPLLLLRRFAAQPPQEIPRLAINLLDYEFAGLPNVDFLSYKMTRAGLWQATRMLALSLAPHVRVNGIAPGAVLPATAQGDDYFTTLRAMSPLGYGVNVDELCTALHYVCHCPSVTGQILVLDGGGSLQAVPTL
jgi:NAD(P)-dependent dehydrogenase (short-subunit alcohol dehydrogenase family)